MFRFWKAISVCFLTGLFFCSTGFGSSLKAGAAQADITPQTGLKMYGYANRKSGATGVLDPLYARVLVLETNQKRFALVILDLGRVFAPSWIEQLRASAKKSSGIDYVLVAAIHTHSGPDPTDQFPPADEPDWETPILTKVEHAIDDAHQHAVEARLGAGYGVVYIGHNRLRDNPDGTASWFERNPTMVPTAPVDPTLAVLRVDDTQGEPIAILVNYACHPVIFGSDNLQYSADWPGVMSKTVEQSFDGKPVVMFLQGGDGDINPYYAVTPLEQDAIGRRDWSGKRVGSEAARVANGITTHADADASLQYAEDDLPMHLRWNPAKFRQALLESWGPDAAAAFDREQKRPMQLPVTTLLIDKRIALMTMPGEPFVDFQMDWRKRCPIPDSFFMGYTDADFGYFPTIRAATYGGYGAANTATRVELGAGNRMVNDALIRVYEFLGKLADIPEDFKNSGK
jgi:Neutral/alkaline non-lysosomal ceramidase, N-terminal